MGTATAPADLNHLNISFLPGPASQPGVSGAPPPQIEAVLARISETIQLAAEANRDAEQTAAEIRDRVGVSRARPQIALAAGELTVPSVGRSPQGNVAAPSKIGSDLDGSRACDHVAGREFELFGLQFSPESAELNQSQVAQINRSADDLKACPKAIIEVRGYADRKTEAESSLDLARERAEEVVSAFVAAGLARDRVRAAAFANERPQDESSSGGQVEISVLAAPRLSATNSEKGSD
ncbi:MAG: OmpA family protein [Pseudomonadota bacterium]